MRAFVGARVLPIVGDPIEDGVLIVDAGRIIAVGPRATTPIPAGAETIDATGRTIMPGIVDTHSHIGGGWGADSSAPIQPEVSVIDSIDVRNPGIQRAQAGGITTANIMAGSGHLVSGRTAYLKFRDANSVEEMLYRDADGHPLGGLKMANGTNPHKEPPFPGTRSKSAALVREQFVKALAYRDKLARAGSDPDKAPERDLAMETLLEVLDGRRIVHHHTHRHDDILTILRLQKEFGFRVVLHHVSDAWKVATEIAAAGVPCSLTNLDSPGGKLETADVDWKNATILDQAGVRIAINTDDWVTDSRLLLRSAALSVRAGLPAEAALRALTINGARMLDLQDRVGSLEPGKDADFLILSGDPFSVTTRVLETWIDGEKVFDLSREPDRLWADGGPGAGDSRRAHLCCFGD